MTHRLATNYGKNYCNRTLTVKVIVENVVTCFFGDIVYNDFGQSGHGDTRSQVDRTAYHSNFSCFRDIGP